MIRLFAALALPPQIAEVLTEHQVGLADARWRPLDALHITLRFFGDVAEDVAADLGSELDGIDLPPLDLELKGAGCFGEGAEIHAIWTGVADNPALTRLAHACEAAARRAGLKPDKRHYHPHVTLAYLRRPDPTAVAVWIQANNLLRSPAFRVGHFGLYSSWRTREGSRYRQERLYPLSAPARPKP